MSVGVAREQHSLEEYHRYRPDRRRSAQPREDHLGEHRLHGEQQEGAEKIAAETAGEPTAKRDGRGAATTDDAQRPRQAQTAAPKRESRGEEQGANISPPMKDAKQKASQRQSARLPRATGPLPIDGIREAPFAGAQRYPSSNNG